MSFEERLDHARREREAGKQVSREAVLNTSLNELRRAVRSRRGALAGEWRGVVTPLLDQLGRATWGPDGYTVVEPDGPSSLTWVVVRVQGKRKLNYRLTLQTDENREFGDPVRNPAVLEPVRPSAFLLAGAHEFTAQLSKQDLEDAMIAVYKDGPGTDGLDPWAQGVLAKSPYKRGEYESTNVWLLLLALASLLAGGYLLMSATASPAQTSELIKGGVVLLVTAALIPVLTSFGRRVDRLHPVKKALVAASVLPAVAVIMWSAIVVFAVIAVIAIILGVLWLALEVLGFPWPWDEERLEQYDRIAEIEEGVRRALRR